MKHSKMYGFCKHYISLLLPDFIIRQFFVFIFSRFVILYNTIIMLKFKRLIWLNLMTCDY